MSSLVKKHVGEVGKAREGRGASYIIPFLKYQVLIGRKAENVGMKLVFIGYMTCGQVGKGREGRGRLKRFGALRKPTWVTLD